MWHELWRREAQTAICWGNLREGDHLEDRRLDGNVILQIDNLFIVNLQYISANTTI